MSTADKIDRKAATDFVEQYLGSDESDGLDEYDKCVHAFIEGIDYGQRDPRLIPLRNLALDWLASKRIDKTDLTEAFRSFLEVVCVRSESEKSQ